MNITSYHHTKVFVSTAEFWQEIISMGIYTFLMSLDDLWNKLAGWLETVNMVGQTEDSIGTKESESSRLQVAAINLHRDDAGQTPH